MEMPPFFTAEQRGQQSTLHFEPGKHPITTDENQAIDNGFSRGDLDAHAWNKEVGERIASYAYDQYSVIMGIDSLTVWSHNDELSLGNAQFLWKWLPARPNKLHHSGTVFVLRGEALGAYNVNLMQPNTKEPQSVVDQAQAKFAADFISGNVSETNMLRDESVAISLGLLTVMGIKTAVAKYNKQLQQEAQPVIQTKNTLSRRRFLQEAVHAAGAVALVSSPLLQAIPSLEAQVAPTEQTMQFWQSVDGIISPKFDRSTSLDGRTALLMAKTEDSGGNVLVMGSGHDDMVQRFRDKTERAKAIKAYAKDILDTGKQLYAGCYHISPDKVPARAIHNLLSYISHVDMFEVTDPGGPTIQPDFPNTVDKHITLVKSFTSPQVEEAISHLRPSN